MGFESIAQKNERIAFKRAAFDRNMKYGTREQLKPECNFILYTEPMKGMECVRLMHTNTNNYRFTHYAQYSLFDCECRASDARAL